MDPLRPTTSIAAPMKIARSFRPFMFPPGLPPVLLYASSRPAESQFEPLEQAENACAPLDQPPEGASGTVSNSRQLSAGRDHLRSHVTIDATAPVPPHRAADDTRPGRASLNESDSCDRSSDLRPGAFVPRPFLGLASRYGFKRSGQRFKETPD